MTQRAGPAARSMWETVTLDFIALGIRAVLAGVATALALVVIVLLSGAAQAAVPDAQETLRLGDAGAGSLLVKADKPDLYRRLPTLRTEVDIRVSGIVARARVVRVSQYFGGMVERVCISYPTKLAWPICACAGSAWSKARSGARSGRRVTTGEARGP